MTTTPVRVVFDCNVFFQALTSPAGPAARLLELVATQDLALFVSAYALDELRDVSQRPHLVAKYRLDATIVEEFIADVRSFATWLDPVPHVFDFGRDPDDAHYVDLALAADAKLIVSRDRHLLDLRAGTTQESQDFQQRFPQLAILTPPEALALVRATQE
jgi:putative PIN family toxin of toxin-antitoxin system